MINFINRYNIEYIQKHYYYFFIQSVLNGLIIIFINYQVRSGEA
jgi:hypothetical protein